MDLVEKAYSISKEDKELALRVYKMSVREIVNKNYLRTNDDAHLELSAIFFDYWSCAKRTSLCRESASESNNAFNYANLNIGISDRFIVTAKSLTDDANRVNNKKLQAMAKQMNYFAKVVF